MPCIASAGRVGSWVLAAVAARGLRACRLEPSNLDFTRFFSDAGTCAQTARRRPNAFMETVSAFFACFVRQPRQALSALTFFYQVSIMYGCWKPSIA
jgi:hypothetical protein